MVHKIIQVLLGLLFFLFAYFQFNDPDPLMWITIYSLVGAGFFIHAFRGVSKKWRTSLLVIVLAFSLIYIPGFIEWLGTPDKQEIFGEMVYDKPYIEETREFLGLIIAALALVYLRSRD